MRDVSGFICRYRRHSVTNWSLSPSCPCSLTYWLFHRQPIRWPCLMRQWHVGVNNLPNGAAASAPRPCTRPPSCCPLWRQTNDYVSASFSATSSRTSLLEAAFVATRLSISRSLAYLRNTSLQTTSSSVQSMTEHVSDAHLITSSKRIVQHRLNKPSPFPPFHHWRLWLSGVKRGCFDACRKPNSQNHDLTLDLTAAAGGDCMVWRR